MNDINELAPDYYLKNFCKLIHHAESWYQDLLTTEEQQWLSSFHQLPHSAQCLLVRLYSRKGDLFRSDKLNYNEIEDIPACLLTLESFKLIELSPVLSNQELASQLLTKPEALAVFPNCSKLLKKKELVDSLSKETFDQFSVLNFTIIKLNSAHIIEVLLALFFANARQDLSQFVLSDLGVHRFENYPLSKSLRFFDQRKQVNQLIELSALSDLYTQLDRKQVTNLDQLVSALPASIGHHYLDRKREHLLNDIARDYERLNNFDTALALFNQTSLPPSRERQARIYDKLEQNQQLADVVSAMLQNPVNISELEVAQKLEQRVRRKQGLAKLSYSKPVFHSEYMELDLSQQRVEFAVKEQYEHLGWTVFYTENSLLNGLLGLTIWEAIYSAVEGAFINAYQTRPLDFYHPSFTANRTTLIEQALNNVYQHQTEHLLETFTLKHGISNPLVQWSCLTRELIELALSHIPSDKLVAIFKIQLSDLKIYRNGMPDLIAFKNGEFKWIEVKGPGDKLQDNQWRWISIFNRLNLNFSVCYVSNKAIESSVSS
ncbi:VRR-NUC domain-containing protein [Vibrio azureus]|uniref:phosphodiesterase I n=1 Tax=Vibrio azureus NBRC 104587 TaxID=1219077 RepID=U3A4A9_9VIBR|nr:VRR-NUC domain-containing protein [Vibrio azureus]AUI87846.1 VRR-NUC domain-containing protein [Vibrio azureus]GAD74806.1 hypothetical protein VAZ01S_015_00500 [Vibrio azureus NBRC 104587]